MLLITQFHHRIHFHLRTLGQGRDTHGRPRGIWRLKIPGHDFVDDGKMTEVVSGDIEPGMELVVDTMRERQ